jgi:hypothetical protein
MMAVARPDATVTASPPGTGGDRARRHEVFVVETSWPSAPAPEESEVVTG